MSTYIFELVITHSVLILAYWIILSRERQYHKMRFYLLASTVFSIILPLFRLPKLFATEVQPLQEIPAVVTAPTTATVVAAPEVSLITFESIMWLSLVISSIFLFKLITRVIYLVRLERHSTNASYHNINVKRVSQVSGSFTFFNWIFLSSDIDENHNDTNAILKHEQAHANLGHSYDLLFFEIYKAIFWWLPSSWYINREIKIIHEYQADACALRSLNIDLYSSILIKSTLQSNGLNIASSFHDGLIFKRLKAMKQQTKKVNNWKFGVLTSLCLSLFLIFACSEEKAAIIGPAPTNDKVETQREEFTKVEEQPSYKGGMDAFSQYVISEIKYPLQARKSGVEGTVQVHFVLERDGSISNVTTSNRIGSGCDEEAIRVVKKATGFKAGSQRGRTVRTAMVMPVTFILNKEKKNADNSVQGTIVATQVSINNAELDVKASYNNGQWTGTVLSPEGDGMPGTNIIVSGTKYGTVADRDGTFSVKAEKGQELHVSFVGYENVVLKK